VVALAIVIVDVLAHVKSQTAFTIAVLLADRVVPVAIAAVVLEGLAVGTVSYVNLEMK